MPSAGWADEAQEKVVGRILTHIEEVPHSISPLKYASDGTPYDIETPRHRRMVIDGVTYETEVVEHGMITRRVEPDESHITRGEN